MHLYCTEYTSISWKVQFQAAPKATAAKRWITEIVGNEFQKTGPPTAKAQWPNMLHRNRGTVKKCWLAISDAVDIGDWDTVVDQVLRCFILKASVNHHSHLVLHWLRNVKPVPV